MRALINIISINAQHGDDGQREREVYVVGRPRHLALRNSLRYSPIPSTLADFAASEYINMRETICAFWPVSRLYCSKQF